jgi:hypothetical protein
MKLASDVFDTNSSEYLINIIAVIRKAEATHNTNVELNIGAHVHR